jgi:BMFP domain-containing protein YqiC
MESQLQQSVPKKTHQEAVAKMQAEINGLTTELGRTKADLEKTTRLEEEIKGLSDQISTQIGAITSQLQSNEAKRVQELEERINGMVDKAEYTALQAKFEEVKASTVPKEDYVTLQNQFSNFVPRESFEEMQKSFTQTTVPREQLAAAEARVQELEAKVANSIPRSEHEELVAKITSMITETPPSDAVEALGTEDSSGTDVAVPLVTSSR